jgi:hypothetical protein
MQLIRMQVRILLVRTLFCSSIANSGYKDKE